MSARVVTQRQCSCCARSAPHAWLRLQEACPCPCAAPNAHLSGQPHSPTYAPVPAAAAAPPAAPTSLPASRRRTPLTPPSPPAAHVDGAPVDCDRHGFAPHPHALGLRHPLVAHAKALVCRQGSEAGRLGEPPAGPRRGQQQPTHGARGARHAMRAGCAALAAAADPASTHAGPQ